MITREIFSSLTIEMRERFNVVDERFKGLDQRLDERFKSLEQRTDEKFKSLNFRLNIFLAIALIALTFANPAFVALIQKLF